MVIQSRAYSGSERRQRGARRELLGAIGGDGEFATNQVLAVLAHELRAPLAAFEVTLDVLRDSTDLDADDLKRLVDRLCHSSRWMAGLVNNLNVLGQLERAWPPLVTTPLPALAVLNASIDLVKPIFDRRQHYARLLCPEPMAWIDANAQLLGQALVNVLTNASAYSPAGEVIDIAVRIINDQVQIRVTDRGPGIAPDERSVIFEPYARGSAARLGGHGLGLGLYVAKTIVERHGGSLGVESVVGQGATFWLNLPRVLMPTHTEEEEV